MIYDVITQLATALKSDTVGLQVEIDQVATDTGKTLPAVPDSHIYGLDAAVDIKTVNLPALILTPTDTAFGTASQSKRDHEHQIGFEYAAENVDENEWRTEAILVAQALMRFLDKFNNTNSTHVGTSGVIQSTGGKAQYITWTEAPNKIRGFALTTGIQERDTF